MNICTYIDTLSMEKIILIRLSNYLCWDLPIVPVYYYTIIIIIGTL